MKKTLITASVSLFALGLFAQGVSNKSTKIDYLEFPKLDMTSISSAQISIYPGKIAIDQNSLHKKSGGLQALQDNINNVNDTYFTFKDIKNTNAAPDVKVEIAFGEFEVVSTADNSHQIPCKHKDAKLSKENIMECPAHYYDVTYKLPTVLIIRDKAGNVLSAEHLTDEGKTTFGYDKSGMSGYIYKPELVEAYNQPGVKNGLAKTALTDRLDELTSYVQEAFYFESLQIKLDFASGKGKDYDYTDLDAAQESAIAGLEAIDKGQDGKAALQKAIDTWLKAVEAIDMSDKKARINRKIGSELYMNLAKAYFFLNEPEKGEENIDEAIKLLRFESNLNRVDEGKAWKRRLNRQKGQLKSIEANRAMTKGERKEVDAFLDNARVKEKELVYPYLQTGDKYATLAAEYEAYAPAKKQAENTDMKQPTNLAEALAMHKEIQKNQSWEDNVQNAPNMGYYISIAYSGLFEELDASIGDVTHLNTLLANNAKLKRVDPAIGKLTQLSNVNLANNQLSEIPKELSNCKELKKLNLKNNQLTSLPAELGQLSNLKSLNISGNNIPQKDIDAIQKQLPKCKIK